MTQKHFLMHKTSDRCNYVHLLSRRWQWCWSWWLDKVLQSPVGQFATGEEQLEEQETFTPSSINSYYKCSAFYFFVLVQTIITVISKHRNRLYLNMMHLLHRVKRQCETKVTCQNLANILHVDQFWQNRIWWGGKWGHRGGGGARVQRY